MLTCTVTSDGVQHSALSLNPNSLNIRWFFFNNRTNHESELTNGTNETRREGGNAVPVVISSTLAISRSSEGNVANLAVGSYYCRVQVNDPTMHANSSQQFMALTENHYLQIASGCDRTSFVAERNVCAVHNTGTNRVTTNPNPSTVDSNTVDSDLTLEGTTSEATLGEDKQLTDPAQPSPDRNGGGTTLQVWIYVLVAVAAVFAMIIIILAIMCVGLCLRRSQSTMDTNCKLPTSLAHNMDANSCNYSALSSFLIQKM